MDLKETYNQIAKDWHEDHGGDDWWFESADRFISYLKPGDTVFDIGCGSGIKAKYFIEKGFSVFGIDFSEEMIAIAKRENPKGKFVVADAGNLEGIQETFPAIFSHAVLIHFPKKNIPEILRSWVEKLESGGYLCLAVKERRPEEKEEMIVQEEDYGYPYERFFSYFSREEVLRYVTDLGLKIVWENLSKGKRPWIHIICQKI